MHDAQAKNKNMAQGVGRHIISKSFMKIESVDQGNSERMRGKREHVLQIEAK